MKRQPHSATILKRWRGEESPSVLRRRGCQPDRAELHQEFPELEDEDIRQALIFASSYLDDRIIELPNRYEAVA